RGFRCLIVVVVATSKLCERACVLYMLCFHRGQLKDIVKPDRFQGPY
uniref:Uncharacterized protein n=1 Tax=Aegilops tauschii subsp. strangulata TaxID=200361 RepID=A0A452YG69_AEGTS